MPISLLESVRAKYPVYADVPDNELALSIADKYPVYLEQDPKFAGYVSSLRQNQPATRPPALTPDNRALNDHAATAGGPPLQPGDVGDLRATLGGMWEDLNTPMAEVLPTLSEENQQVMREHGSTTGKIAAGTYQGVAGLANYFTSPLGIATLGLGALPRAAQRAVSLAFAAQMASEAPQLATELGTATAGPMEQWDPQMVAELTTSALGLTAFTTLAAKHGLTPARAEMISALANQLKQPAVRPQGEIRFGNERATALVPGEQMVNPDVVADPLRQPEVVGQKSEVSPSSAPETLPAEATPAPPETGAAAPAAPAAPNVVQRPDVPKMAVAELKQRYVAEQGELAKPFAERGGPSAQLAADRVAEAKRVAELPDAKFVDEVGKEWVERQAGSGASAMGDPIAAPVPATPPPAPSGAPGSAMLFDARLPVTLPRTAPGSVSVPQIMESMQNVLRMAGSDAGNIRTGRFNTGAARGIWKPHEEIVRLASADNIPTATHEIGHGLQQKVYGTALAKGLKFLTPAIRRELIGLGKALYGGRKPVAGYSGEGFAEFARYWITTEDAAKVAPAMTKFFEGTFLPAHPEIAKALTDARDLVSIWRAQGSIERARRQVVREPGAFRRMAEALAKFVGYQSQFESAAPIESVSKAAAKRLGRPLRPSEDPYQLYSWKRGSGGATVERMATEHMLDVWGNPTGPSLAEALAPVKGQRNEFLLYLFARRAMERWGKNINPGISREDAAHIKAAYDKPEFQIAAQKYYDWWDGLLSYVVQADPSMTDVVTKIRAGSSDYAPLARMIDPLKAKAAAAAAKSNPFMRMFGSGLPVKDIFDQTFINAARLVNRANRALVTNAIVKLSNIQGLGHIVEEVPRTKVLEQVNIEQIRKQMEDMGVDTTAIPTDEMLKYYSLADMAKGADPIVSVKDAAGNQRWYHVDPRLYDTLEGLQTFSLKQSFPGIPYLGQVLDLLLGAPSRAFRLGTTGLRPAFSLVTNPTRDLTTLLAQTTSNPAKVAAMYPAALIEAMKGGKYKDAFYDLGAHLGQPLGTDIGHTQRVSKEMFHGRLMRTVTNPIDHLRELLSITESAPRIAELRAVADDIGWKPGTAMTPDQAVQLALAAKRVTVDFSAAGDVGRIMNQAVPFYNPALQGLRSFLRTFKNSPAKGTLMGLALFTAPALVTWWANKDKEWYRALPWRERYIYTHIDDGKNVWQIPRPFEWGNAFMVIPEAIMDSWYQKDPEAAKQALGHVFSTTVPTDYPVLLKLAKEQWQNRIDFWDRPIVPRSEVDLPASEQRGPYTSKLATSLNRAFPDLSPRRVDAAVRGYFGGAGTDLMQMIGLGSERMDRQWEASDFPVFGTVFRRGGGYNAQNQHINDFWDLYLPSQARVQGFLFARSQAQQGLRSPDSVREPDEADVVAVKIGQAASRELRVLQQTAARTKETDARASLYKDAGRIAKEAGDQIRQLMKDKASRAEAEPKR